MVLQFAYEITLILLCSINTLLLASAQETPIIAQPGCNTTCGNVTIPYPFGMNDPKCYADKWFEIECKSNGVEISSGQEIPRPPTPYLKQLNLNVKSIDPSASTINIYNPSFTLNCEKRNGVVTDLRGGPFVYSQERNIFVAQGCNRISFLMSNGGRVGACASICDANEDIQADVFAGKCNGKYCCKTSLPLHLVEYNVTTENLTQNNDRTGGEQCSYAVIVEQDAWDSVGSFLTGFENLNLAAVLEWEIVDSSMKLSGNCNNTNVTSSEYSHSGRRCYCGEGFYGNPYINPGGCIRRDRTIPVIDPKSQAKWAIGISSSFGSIVLLIVVWLSYEAIRKRIIKKRKEKFFKKNGGLLLQQRLSSSGENVDKVVLFNLDELEKATDNFNLNRVLGKGGQGTVYKGMLVDGRIVAVKKFKVQGKTEEFVNEFAVLSQINHRNVVKLLGCCLETEIPLLVYEFIPNGNLFEYLHDQSEDLPMTWEMRLRIATEISGALFYLHSVASQPIYHRDIKSTNILLDEKYRAKVADFGTSRIVSIEATHLTTAVQGTFGYLDPEYFHTSQFTEKSDVYSFGVVLVELLTGKKPILHLSSEEARSLASYFSVAMDENRFFDIIDKRVQMEGDREHIIAVANLAYRCLELNGKKRPTMKEVTLELEGIQRLVRKSDVQQNLEEQEIEADRIEEYQDYWTGYSTSDTLPTTSDGELLSDVLPILTLK